jgi:hypothetical protein
MRKTAVRTAMVISLLGAGFASGYAVAQQVHLKAAEDALNTAVTHLKLHTPDTGGHAALAIKSIETAKQHIEAAMKGAK